MNDCRYVVVWLEKDEGSTHGRIAFSCVNTIREAMGWAETYGGIWMTAEEFEKFRRGE